MTDFNSALEALGTFGPILAVKLYRVKLDPPPAAPLLPCLDHEAMLHQVVPPHAAAYVQERATGDLHEVVFIPARRRIEVDMVSTAGSNTPDSHVRLLALLEARFPGDRVVVRGPSWWRGDRRVVAACRAQVSLAEVLLGHDIGVVKTAVDRLQTVGALMEKQSRVASWAVRTVTAPILAAAGFLSYQVLGLFTADLGDSVVTALRYVVVSILGAMFLYYGLKAVQLTEMSNRVWKRAAEYRLILTERGRLERLR